MKTKNIILATLLLINLSACKRIADQKTVQNNYIEKNYTEKLEPKELNVDHRVRAMTLLSYPIKSDLDGWNFHIGEETSASWALFISSLTFGNKIKTKFDSTDDSNKNITDIVMVVQSAGESRDQAYKKIVPLKKELTILDEKIERTKAEKTPTDLVSTICYYAKRPTGSKPFECKTVADDTFSKEKTADNCRDFLRLKFLDIDQNPKIVEQQTICRDVQVEIDSLKETSLEIDQQIANETLVRSAGESVVIDLLQSIEKNKTDLVLIATGATLEKNKDPNDAISELVIDENNTIKSFKLVIDFGPNLSSGSGKFEYSRELNNIKNFSFLKESDGVWTLRFDLITSDFIIKTNLSYSNHPTLGMRFVGDAHFHYPNGKVRKGVMKLEFDHL